MGTVSLSLRTDVVCCCGSASGALTSLSPPLSAAVVTAISLYMRHLGVRTKSGDKKSGRNFFRKKVLRSSLALCSLRIPWGGLEPACLQSLSASCLFGSDSLPFCHFPTGDGESAVRRAPQDKERAEQYPRSCPLEPGRAIW